ncbi:MAG: hypothetical protein HOP12_08670 [Candidatus Eisenbacteria bacterium]|uniref:Serine aminopeptidase S33 domain-containing protein n=1 Tax=Eiseniibacteriota bacterium TaxID=2212470 RepID=A0A849SI15_UNCEI|nr:hypothetical protein [Candidatus Eisenbacteria bacterium]
MLAPTVASESPLSFESEGLPLYGVYHAPAEARDRPVVVHVHGLGVEQISTYRAEVLNARALAAAGVPVLRFHARGHGDSAGNFADVTIETLTRDANAAADEARRRSGAKHVVWLGVRFGARVRRRRPARRDDAVGLAMWEPLHRGPEYFRAMLRGLLFSQVAAGKKPEHSVDELLARVAAGTAVDVHGYYLHPAVFESLADRSLGETLATWSGPTLLVQIQSRARLTPDHAALLEAVQARGARVQSHVVREDLGWHFTQNPAWESPALVAATREWVDALD